MKFGQPPQINACRTSHAFTLVELLVATALTLFIMVILSEAFVAGAQTFADLKAVGDMNNRLRIASTVMRADLSSALLNSTGQKVSQVGPPAAAGSLGFFRVWQDLPHTTLSLAFTAPPPLPPPPPSTIQVATVSGPATQPEWKIQQGTVLIIDAGVFHQNAPDTPREEVAVVANVVGNAVTLTSALTQNHDLNAPVIVCDGADPDNLVSVTSKNHTLHFTVNLSQAAARRRENYLGAILNGDTNAYAGQDPLWNFGPAAFRDATTKPYNSQWAEVAYFLRENQSSTPGDPTVAGDVPMRLYNLYRRQVVAVTDNPPRDQLNTANGATPATNIANALQYTGYYEVSCKPDPTPNRPGLLYFNGPQDLTIPERRFGMNAGIGSAGLPLDASPSPAEAYVSATTLAYRKIGENSVANGATENAALVGSDILLNDVISMDVQVFVPKLKLTDFGYLPPVGTYPANHNTAPGYSGNRVYDTWSSEPAPSTPPAAPAAYNPYDYFSSGADNSVQTVPFNYSTVIGIQIVLRIWDRNTQKTRQMTIIQDL